MKYKLSVLSFAFFFATDFLAAGTSPQPHQVFSQITKISIVTHVPFKQQEFTQIVDLIDHVGSMVKSHVLLPQRLNVLLERNMDNAYFEIPDILVIPYQFKMEDFAKNPIFTRPVIAHEFGHSILETNMRQRMPEWKELSDLRSKIFIISEQMDGLRKGLAKLEDTPANKTKILEIGKMIESLAKKNAPMEGAIDQNRLAEIDSAYHEFFADVIAVLYGRNGQKDPKAISNALHLTGMLSVTTSQEWKAVGMFIDARDFTMNFTGPQLNNWSDGGDPHITLSPARAYLWDYYLDNPLLNHYEAEIVDAVIDAIHMALSERLNNTQLFDLTPPQANRRLIQALEQKLSALTTQVKQDETHH